MTPNPDFKDTRLALNVSETVGLHVRDILYNMHTLPTGELE